MRISWYNREHHSRAYDLTTIDDIQKYEVGELFCLRIRKDKVSIGGTLGQFKSAEQRDKAYDEIKAMLKAGAEEFEFRPGYYEHNL